MSRTLPWLLLAAALSGICCSRNAQARPREVILLRHAEKPEDPKDPHLTEAGRERARFLASYLTTTPALTNAGLPTVLIATGWTRHSHSRRPFETLEPLAKRLHRSIKRPFLSEEYAQLARYILTSRECDDKVVVVCWVHEFLPDLAAARGVHPRPPLWKGHVYDRVWVITWPEGQAQLTELVEPPVQ